jgi:AcrR family transcriptional regulator
VTTPGLPTPIEELPAGDGTVTDARWRERSLERSLKSARDRAMSRGDRFMAAATELVRETNRTDFTVQQIVERSKMSLRSFYQHFASKDELLLALFEEAISQATARLRLQVDGSVDPIDRLRTYVIGLHDMKDEDPTNQTNRAFTIYHLRLAESHPAEFAHAIAPLVDLLLEIIEAGVTAGCFRDDLPAEQQAMILTQTLVSTVQMTVLGVHMAKTNVTSEQLFAFCLGGVIAPGAEVPRPARGQRTNSSR